MKMKRLYVYYEVRTKEVLLIEFYTHTCKVWV